MRSIRPEILSERRDPLDCDKPGSSAVVAQSAFIV